MAIAQDWMQFLWEERSDVWIAERSGIPRSTLGFVRRGERELPSQYQVALRSIYQSETITRMDTAGLPHRESMRYALQPPDRVRDIVWGMNNIVERLASFSTARASWAAEEADLPFDWDSTYADYTDQIASSIHESPYSYDDIEERYGLEGR